MNEHYRYPHSFWLLICESFLYFMTASISGPIVAPYCAQLGGSGSIMGLAVGCINLSSLLTRPLAGSLADQLPRKQMALLGFGLMGVSNLLCAAAGSAAVLLGSRLLVGIGFSMISVSLSTWVAACLPRDRVGSGMGIFGMAQAVSAAIAPTLGLEIGERIGYRAVFLCAAGIAGAGTVMIPFLDAPALPECHSRARRTILAAEVLPIAAILPLVTIPNAALSSFLSIYAAEHSLPLSISIYFPVYAGMLFVLRLLTSRQMDTISYRIFVLICAPAASLSLIAITYMRGYVLLVLSAMLMSIGYGILNSVSLAACMKVVPPDRQGTASSTYYIGLDLGLLLGPVLGGQIYEHIGSSHLFLILAIIPWLSLPILAVFNRYLREKGI